MDVFGFFIETSMQKGFVAIFKNGEVLNQLDFAVGPLADQDVFLVIQTLLASQPMHIQDFSYFAVSVGPGSYTGMRAGGIVGATFAACTKKPLITVTSLEGLERGGKTLPVINAKRGKVYYQTDKEGPQLGDVEVLNPFLAQGYTLVSPHVKVLAPLLPGRWEEVETDLQRLAVLVFERFKGGEFVDPKNVQLLYMQQAKVD